MTEDRDFRSWNITPEQADKIRAGDSKESADFYLKNIKRFTKMAQKFVNLHGTHLYDVDYMVSQLYLDLPYLDWTNALSLTMSIKHISFIWSAYGGYAQRVDMKLPHIRMPWNYYPSPENIISIDSPLFEADEDGDSFLDRYVVMPEEESPEGILLLREDKKRLTTTQIVERLKELLSPREAEYLELYLENYSYTNASAKMGVNCDCIKKQLFSKLKRNYVKVVEAFSDVEIFSRYKGLVPQDLEKIVRDYEKIKARKRKGDSPKFVYSTDAEREEAKKASKHKWYEKNKELQNERKRARRAAEREARKARASV